MEHLIAYGPADAARRGPSSRRSFCGLAGMTCERERQRAFEFREGPSQIYGGISREVSPLALLVNEFLKSRYRMGVEHWEGEMIRTLLAIALLLGSTLAASAQSNVSSPSLQLVQFRPATSCCCRYNNVAYMEGRGVPACYQHRPYIMTCRCQKNPTLNCKWVVNWTNGRC